MRRKRQEIFRLIGRNAQYDLAQVETLKVDVHSAKNITRRSWAVIPMPYTVIAQVNDLSK